MELQLHRQPLKESAPRDLTLVHFTGSKVSLNEQSQNHIHDQLLALADEPSESDLLLDFSNVKFLTSTTLATLLSLHKKLLSRGRHLTVGNLSPQAYEVFSVTRLDTFLDLRLAGQANLDSPPSFPAGVLVVDDDMAVLCVLAARLREKGYQVWVASHGHQAVQFYQRYRKEIALILLDVLMPGMDGPHTLTALQKICPTVRCCFMVGNSTLYSEEGLLAMGAVRVFQKPFPFTEVLDTLKQLASRSPRCREDRWIIPVERSVNDAGTQS